MPRYGSCIKCGRRVRNRVYYKGLNIYICPRHLKEGGLEEVAKSIDWGDIERRISIIESKIDTIIDKVDSLARMVSQRRLDYYRIYKAIEDSRGKGGCEIEILEELRRRYPLHYRVEDGIITVHIDAGIKQGEFNKLNDTLTKRGYKYRKDTYKWIKTI